MILFGKNMDKLVICCYCDGGEGGPNINIIPFEYVSKENAEFDLLAAWEKKKEELDDKSSVIKNYIVKLGSLEIDYNNLTYRKAIRNEKNKIIGYEKKYSEPEIFELEEWWEKHKE
jgi:hypothetical protein